MIKCINHIKALKCICNSFNAQLFAPLLENKSGNQTFASNVETPLVCA